MADRTFSVFWRTLNCQGAHVQPVVRSGSVPTDDVESRTRMAAIANVASILRSPGAFVSFQLYWQAHCLGNPFSIEQLVLSAKHWPAFDAAPYLVTSCPPRSDRQIRSIGRCATGKAVSPTFPAIRTIHLVSILIIILL